MPRSERPEALERFQYTRVGEHVAVLQLLARLAVDLGAPSQAQLLVRRDSGYAGTFSARACRSERRLLAGGESELLWRALFAVPYAVVEAPSSLFRLTGEGRPALALPTPGVRPGNLPALSFTPNGALAHDLARLTPGALRHRALALATAVAVTATSAPALALADAGVAMTTSAHAHATAQHIEHLAELAAERSRRESASRHAARGSSTRNSSRATSKGSRAASKGSRAAAARKASGAPSKGSRAEAAHRTSPAEAAHRTSSAQSSRKSSRAASRRSSGPEASAGLDAARLGFVTKGRARRVKHTGLTHPSVTHIFSAPARSAPQSSNTPVCAPAANPSAGGSSLTSRGKLAAHRVNTKAGHSRLIVCPAPGTTDSPGTGTGNTGTGTTTTPAPTPAPGSGTGTTTTPAPTPAPGSGTGTTTTPAPTPAPGSGTGTTTTPPPLTPGPPTVTGGHREAASHRPAPPLRPFGGLSKRPPVKLGSGTATTGGAPTLVPSPPGFLGPKSWTGTVTNNPALSGALGNLSNLLSNGSRPPRFLIPVYMEAGRRYHVPWEVLAAINAVESDYGRDLSTSSAGAIGWMQFEPSTWHQYGVAADGHSVPNPYDPRDAIFSAARYLAAAGAAQDISRAVYAYNHATWYVNMVLTRAQAIAAGVHVQRQTLNKRGVVSVYFATAQRRDPVIRFKGGVLSHYDRLIASANMVSAANFPYVYGGGHEQPARFGPFDCSGSVSYVMQQAGYKVPTTVSGEIPIWKFPAGPGRVTIFYNPTHTFMRIGNRYFGTSGFARPAGGAGWFDTGQIPTSYLAQFREVHVPRLGINSFAPAKTAGGTQS